MIDLTGGKYGRFTVLGEAPKKGRRRMWECSCSCGIIVRVEQYNLSSGKSTSCGCASRENTINRNTKHGLSTLHKKAFNAWNSMMQRCYNENHPRYSDWGGRGIRVYKRWHSFKNFLSDMGDPKPGRYLDRKNNDKNYSKNNCRWVTAEISVHNRRNSKVKPRVRLQPRRPMPAKLVNKT